MGFVPLNFAKKIISCFFINQEILYVNTYYENGKGVPPVEGKNNILNDN